SELGLTDGWESRLRVEAVGVRDAELRRATYHGLPFGDAGFVEEMEAKCGRKLRPQPPGPRPKARSAATVRDDRDACLSLVFVVQRLPKGAPVARASTRAA